MPFVDIATSTDLSRLTSLELTFGKPPPVLPSLPTITQLRLSCLDLREASTFSSSFPFVSTLTILDCHGADEHVVGLAPQLRFLRLELRNLPTELVARVLSIAVLLDRLEIGMISGQPDLDLVRLQIEAQPLPLPELVVRLPRWLWLDTLVTFDECLSVVYRAFLEVRKIERLVLEAWMEKAWANQTKGGLEVMVGRGIGISYEETEELSVKPY